ncbi:hypothetical protein IWQ60_011559 [Tieghemiomyces parasiticus]|uniref:CCHC-type domain-containing protein n=1 Tax=Tieghemiomyces parasiticus TaxID=78921 RepID=A0A9W7ZNR0_9FUNG|nr:hypothetical protein IWQ60_011559 [Tieghemiomyces parasiticus]
MAPRPFAASGVPALAGREPDPYNFSNYHVFVKRFDLYCRYWGYQGEEIRDALLPLVPPDVADLVKYAPLSTDKDWDGLCEALVSYGDAQHERIGPRLAVARLEEVVSSDRGFGGSRGLIMRLESLFSAVPGLSDQRRYKYLAEAFNLQSDDLSGLSADMAKERYLSKKNMLLAAERDAISQFRISPIDHPLTGSQLELGPHVQGPDPLSGPSVRKAVPRPTNSLGPAALVAGPPSTDNQATTASPALLRSSVAKNGNLETAASQPKPKRWRLSVDAARLPPLASRFPHTPLFEKVKPVCYYCEQEGHLLRYCPDLSVDLAANKAKLDGGTVTFPNGRHVPRNFGAGGIKHLIHNPPAYLKAPIRTHPAHLGETPPAMEGNVARSRQAGQAEAGGLGHSIPIDRSGNAARPGSPSDISIYSWDDEL